MTLHDALASLLDAPAAGSLLVGFSGGIDSSVLLHALAASTRARSRGLRAIHVDHGLHADSGAWAERARTVCAALDVELDVVIAKVDRDTGLGLEGAAREARYRAFAARMAPDAIIVLAHHAGDQAETVLQRLLRGSGPRGAAGMRPWRPFDRGWIARPLLRVQRATIEAYAKRHGVTPIDDPSNLDTRHDRNYLRQRVLPLLVDRWPEAVRSIGHGAEWFAGAARVVEERVALELARAATLDPCAMRLDVLATLDDFLLQACVQRWVSALGFPEPPIAVLRRIRDELVAPRADANPMLAWSGVELRRHRKELHALRAAEPVPADWTTTWDGLAPLRLPAGAGTLSVIDGRFESGVAVRFRSGGETIRERLAGPTHLVKKRLNELGVPPWVRQRTPLLFDRDGVAAVGDLIVAERLGGRLRWSR